LKLSKFADFCIEAITHRLQARPIVADKRKSRMDRKTEIWITVLVPFQDFAEFMIYCNAANA